MVVQLGKLKIGSLEAMEVRRIEDEMPYWAVYETGKFQTPIVLLSLQDVQKIASDLKRWQQEQQEKEKQKQ